MRIRNELWQGCFGYWQNQFIHHHVLVLGHTAWLGYLNAGRGLVVCKLLEAVPSSIDWETETVAFNCDYLPQAQVAAYLQAELNEAAVAALLAALTAYEPTRDMVLAVGNGALDINLLQRMAIPPADCYAQVQRRWAEF